MYFFFSKILLIFILPFTWFLAFFIAALLVKKPALKRRYYIISAFIVLIFSNHYIINAVADAWDIRPVPLKTGTYSCAIVLGGFAGEAANGDGVFNNAADRFIQAIKLKSTGKVSNILVSGGNGNLLAGSFKEADWVKKQLELLKVPDSCIFAEDRSRNTIENALYSKEMLQKSKMQPPYLLITSAFHMRRALYIFKKYNIDVTPYPCNYVAGNSPFHIADMIPDVEVFGQWNLYIKEMVGTLVTHLKK